MIAALHHQLLVTDLPALPLHGLPAALRNFCQRPTAYREDFLQSRFGKAFDGYSYPGQEDSLNQGPEDQLHSFVLSDFSPALHYPPELQPFLRQHWAELTRAARVTEQRILTELGLEDIARQHEERCGHMLSANYYPPLPAGANAIANIAPQKASALRLSPHPDVSLLTVLFAGIAEDFQYQDSRGLWLDAEPADKVVVFAGELLQWLTDGAIPALNHRVKRGENPGERFSFALFSLPAPGATLVSNAGRHITTEDWYRLHLSQWDN